MYPFLEHAQEAEEKVAEKPVAEKPAANGRPEEDLAEREAPKGIPALPNKPKKKQAPASAPAPAPTTPEAA